MTEQHAFGVESAPGAPLEASDSYQVRDGAVIHELTIGALRLEAEMARGMEGAEGRSAWWRSYLVGGRPKAVRPIGGKCRMVDLFCGVGGLANGIGQLCDEIGTSLVAEFIADQDEAATLVYAANHPTRQRYTDSVTKLVDYSVRHARGAAEFAYAPELLDEALSERLAGIDLVLAGPPCQGHSNLNNRTRRSDPRNELYLSVPAFAVAVGARMCIIENVREVLRDEGRVVETAERLFESEGYRVETGMLSASELGWPQTRTRHFLVACKDRRPIPFDAIRSTLRDAPRSLWWAISDLEDESAEGPLTQASELSERNKERIDWLFDNDQHELGLEERPISHQAGTTYTAVYGRLHHDRPAPTITTGFLSPGRGRFTHPTQRRALTPHEGARLQGFPDGYRFILDPRDPPARTSLAKWIGGAVPMPLGYAAALSAFGSVATAE